MAEIRILDKHTAGLIAAGEVVERPASVVKELVENAIDAGAKRIEVEIAAGGLGLIEIRDDGCGIEPAYLPNAFVRHATSKIACEADLEAIHTLGFRGEALASVADVARVSLLTRAAGEAVAWRYDIAGGEALDCVEDARAPGTTVTVRDLFFNTPARMKFLKKDASEAALVQDAVEHLALSHPEIAFRYIRDGREVFFTPGDGRLTGTVRALFARDYAQTLLPVSYEENGMAVTGLITPPAAARASRGMQHFYVNGRYVKSRTMMAAMENAYKGMLMGGRFPGCVLMLTLPPAAVDVNVHPAKTEVRFAREGDVFNAVYRAVKATLLRPGSLEERLELTAKAPRKEQKPQGVQIGFSALDAASGVADGPATANAAPPAAAPVQPAAPTLAKAPAVSADAPARPMAGRPADPPRRKSQPLYSPLSEDGDDLAMDNDLALNDGLAGAPAVLTDGHGARRSGFARNAFAGLDIEVDAAPAPVEGRAAEDPAAAKTPPAKDSAAAAPPAPGTPAPAASAAEDLQEAPAAAKEKLPLTVLGEVFRTYIVAQRGEEVCFIDKHAAHERLLYERLAADYGHVAGQLLLTPVSVELSAEEKTALLAEKEYLEGIGLSLDDFGGRTVLVREVPADIRADSIEGLVEELAGRLAAGQRQPLAEKTAWVLHSIACRAAVKGGDAGRLPELIRLAEDILDGDVLPFCPHGRPVVLRISRKELEKQFGRLG